MSEAREVYWRYLPRTLRPRFTVVEYVIGVFLLLVLVRLGLPFALAEYDERRAFDVLEAVVTLEDAVRRAARAGDLAALADQPAGRMPAGLDNYLPEGFTFDRDRWSIDWDFYEVRGSARDFFEGDLHGSIELRIESDRLRAAVARAAGPRVWLVEDDRVSVLVPDLTRDSGSGA